MPQRNGGGGDDLCATDEMIAFKDEGEQEEKIQEHAFLERDLADLKSSLVHESETHQQHHTSSEAVAEAIRRAQDGQRIYSHNKLRDHMDDELKHQGGMYKGQTYASYPFLMLPDPYLSNASMTPALVMDSTDPDMMSACQQGSRTTCCIVNEGKASYGYGVGFMEEVFFKKKSENANFNDRKTVKSNKVPVVQPSHGVHPFTSLLPYSNENFSHPSHSPHQSDINQKQGVHRSQQGPDLSSFYSLPTTGVGQITSSVGWFPHPLMIGTPSMHSTGIPHPAIVPSSGKQDTEHYDRCLKPHPEPKRENESKKPTVKKPLNAFMLYMKEMRPKVIAECTLKESAAINQILGRRWHALSREEQAKYYELARKERQLHMQLYPGWSARDNYGKKKRRTREKQQDSSSDPGSPKKCRARFGLNQQTDWCGPCRRKKKCIRYLQGERHCISPVSSNGSAIDSPPSPLDGPLHSALTSDNFASPAQSVINEQTHAFLASTQTKPSDNSGGQNTLLISDCLSTVTLSQVSMKYNTSPVGTQCFKKEKD
ncbi:transcription factor 7 isoform X2 [Protopterus annectens]|uniref:transcription factor 7 isoform X2 n=1 Tax=Protopterus annectens TaxID=7888 RepID=UPI001CF9F291|nr:transcription factor 7 isoform X2 [Protopterus annectens]